jgi:hypothetical protein
MRGSGPSRPDRRVLGVDVPPEHDDRDRARPGAAQRHGGRLRARPGRPGVIEQQDPAIRHRCGLKPVRIEVTHPVVVGPGDELGPTAAQVRGDQRPERVRANPPASRRHHRQVRRRPADPGPLPATSPVITQEHQQQGEQQPPSNNALLPSLRPPSPTPATRPRGLSARPPIHPTPSPGTRARGPSARTPIHPTPTQGTRTRDPSPRTPIHPTPAPRTLRRGPSART